MKKLPDKCINLTLTDIPYAECDKESQGIRKFDKGNANTLTFNLESFALELKRITKDSIYIFCGIEQISSLFRLLDIDMSTRLCIWQKSNPSPVNGQYLWLSAIEACIFAKFPSATFNEHCKPNVWKFPCGTSDFHPTQKPIDLFSYLIKTSSKEGDIVFDPCAGSGTTGIACINNSRNFILTEQNLEFYQKAKTRLNSAISTDIFSLQNT